MKVADASDHYIKLSKHYTFINRSRLFTKTINLGAVPKDQISQVFSHKGFHNIEAARDM